MLGALEIQVDATNFWARLLAKSALCAGFSVHPRPCCIPSCSDSWDSRPYPSRAQDRAHFIPQDQEF